MPPPTVFLGLGSNLGDREANLAGAQRALERRGFRVAARGSTYLTEPKDAPPQAWFLNLVVAGTTSTRCPDESQVVLHRARGDGAA